VLSQGFGQLVQQEEVDAPGQQQLIGATAQMATKLKAPAAARNTKVCRANRKRPRVDAALI
jgi:hypothetical protein